MNNSIRYLLFAAATFAVAIIMTFIIRKIMDSFFRRFADKLNTEPTNFSFLKNSVGFVIYTAAIFFIINNIPPLKEIGTALFAGAGVLAVIVGFASQKAFANIISGIFILIFKPFKIADIIEFKDGQAGIVEGITLRHTLIKDFENKRIIIPNSVISEETIINSNIQDEQIRKHVVFSISYDSNIDKAMDIISDEAEKHPLTIDRRSREEIEAKERVVLVRVIALNDFSVDLKAYLWTTNFEDAFALKCDILKSVKERFEREGIEIPFPYRTVVYKTDIEQKERTRLENED